MKTSEFFKLQEGDRIHWTPDVEGGDPPSGGTIHVTEFTDHGRVMHVSWDDGMGELIVPQTQGTMYSKIISCMTQIPKDQPIAPITVKHEL